MEYDENPKENPSKGWRLENYDQTNEIFKKIGKKKSK